jgi:hypothetical protein
MWGSGGGGRCDSQGKVRRDGVATDERTSPKVTPGFSFLTSSLTALEKNMKAERARLGAFLSFLARGFLAAQTELAVCK